MQLLKVSSFDEVGRKERFVLAAAEVRLHKENKYTSKFPGDYSLRGVVAISPVLLTDGLRFEPGRGHNFWPNFVQLSPIELLSSANSFLLLM